MIPFGKRPKTLPAVLSRDEVLRLFAALPDNRDRMLVRTAYACGLRISEVVRLRVADIDSCRGVLVIRQGKGHKDRLVPLSPALAGGAADVLAALPAGGLAVSRPDARPAPASRRLAADVRAAGAAAGLEQARQHAHAAAQLRHAPAGSRRRRGDAAAPAGPPQPVDDGPLPARQHASICSARPVRWTRLLAMPAAPAVASALPRGGRAAPGRAGHDRRTPQPRPALEVADVLRAARRGLPGDARAAPVGATTAGVAGPGPVPHGGAGRPHRALRRLRAAAHRLQLVPQPPLSRSARRRRGRWLDAGKRLAVAGGVPPRGVHAAGRPWGRWPCRTRACCTTCCCAAAWETLRELAPDPHHLGAQVGVLVVLHTWGQKLRHHPHVHCVVTGGGLACDADGPVEATGALGGVPAGLLPAGAGAEPAVSRQVPGGAAGGARPQASSACHGRLAALAEPAAFAAWLTPLYAQEWVVYAKPPFGGPEQVLKYLARYTHRVAISNSRLVKLDGRPGDVPLQGLRRRPAAEDADAVGGGVPAAFRAARVAEGLREDPALRPAGQSLPGGEAAGLPAVAGGRGGGGRPGDGPGPADRAAALPALRRPGLAGGGASATADRGGSLSVAAGCR